MGAKKREIKRNSIGEIIEIDLTVSEVNKICQISELQEQWYLTYYPTVTATFDCFLKYNHMKLYSKLSAYTDQQINDRTILEELNKTINLYDYLNEIMECCEETEKEKS